MDPDCHSFMGTSSCCVDRRRHSRPAGATVTGSVLFCGMILLTVTRPAPANSAISTTNLVHTVYYTQLSKVSATDDHCILIAKT